MKKNLTFLMMLMAFVGILSAQSGPKFNYQAVVRHHVTVDGQEMDTLYHNNPVNITITILGGIDMQMLFTECHNNVMTDDNGFVSIVLGEGECHQSDLTPLSKVDWRGAQITVDFQLMAADDTHVSGTMDVQPVPFALQANPAPLTTNGIAAYLHDVDQDEALQVLNALVVDNPELQEDIEEAIEQYLKTSDAKLIAKDIAASYLTHFDAGNVQELYDALNGNDAVKNRLKQLVKAYVQDPENEETVKGLVSDLVLYYLSNITMTDVEAAHNNWLQIPVEQRQDIKHAVRTHLEDYVKSDAARSIIIFYAPSIITSIPAQEVEQAWAYLEAVNDPVKVLLRTTLNTYINAYLTEHGTATNITLDEAVENAVNNYTQNHPLIPIPTTCGSVITGGVWTLDGTNPGVCTLKQLYVAH
jgi:hypothetical protein